MIVRVPRFVIGMAGLPGGYRMPDRPKRETRVHTPTTVDRSYIPADNYWKGNHNKDSQTPVDIDDTFWKWEVIKNDSLLRFDYSQFRMFAVDVDLKSGTVLGCVCRQCDELMYTNEEKKKHISESGCPSILQRAYMYLRRDKKCIICDRYTSDEKWGIPLCTKGECMETFMHDIPQPEVLRAAITLVKMQDGTYTGGQ